MTTLIPVTSEKHLSWGEQHSNIGNNTNGGTPMANTLFSSTQKDWKLNTDNAHKTFEDSIPPIATLGYAIDTSHINIIEGDTLTTTVLTLNVDAGTTLYWAISGIDSTDLNKGNLTGSGIVSNDGTFSFSHHFREDLTTEGTEQITITLFTDKDRKTSVAETTLKLLDSSTTSLNTPTNLQIDSHVIPARFSGKRIPIKTLIDFSTQESSNTFTFNNSQQGGYFEYNGKIYQGEELRNLAITDLGDLYYTPKAPIGHYDTSELKVIATQSPTETHRPKKGDKTNPKGKTSLVITNSLKTIRQRQDPFDPRFPLQKLTNPSIQDQISVSVETAEGRSQPISGEWITRGNWTPEINLLQRNFKASKPGSPGHRVSDLLDISDLDGDEIVQINIKDRTSEKETGYFAFKNKIYQGKTLPALTENDLENVFFHPGLKGLNQIEVRAEDSLGGSSHVFRADLHTQKAAKATLDNRNQSFKSSDIGQPVPLKTLINISTKQATDANTYDLKLTSKEKKNVPLGYFRLDKKRLTSKQLTGLSQDTVRKIHFVPTASNTKASFILEATDLLGKTTKQSATWTTRKNKKPKLNLESIQLYPSQAKRPIEISHLIRAQDDGGYIKSYTLQSINGKGNFQFKGKTVSKQRLTIRAADLDHVTYQAPAPGINDRIKVTASDGDQESRPASASWGTNSDRQSGSRTRRFSIGINEEWAIGDFLGVQNERTYSKFLGMDKTINNVNLNRDIGVAGVRFKTGNTRMKAGLQLDAGYGLGSLALQGGLSASATLDADGISFRGTSSAPRLELELPYAYLDLDAVGKFKFDPSLKFWYDFLLTEGTTQNLLNILNTDVDISRSLIDLDTRHITGNNYTRSFNIGAFSANASIPNFGRVSELNGIPAAIQRSNTWDNGFGDGIAYGMEGSTTLLDLNLSLGQVASYFGLPLSINQSIWGGDLSVTGTLADASIGIDAELNYAAKVAVKSNVFATIEGSTPNRKYDILGGNSLIDRGQFRDTNNDGNISVTIEADPILAANASVSIDGGVTANADVLSASARFNKWGYNQTWNVGPLWSGGPWNLYSNEVSLIDMTRSYALSDLAPNLQDQLSVTLELPIA